ncbi:hypothetical protein HAX54_047182 [Datura stramonium]|uniref:Uncharacterized protein n=1 Tax=Datura stramonium TaxID=4076 RepID=A0ABS8SSE3_DATST|nr:hypothetical protein [Datura stramonium]
MHGNFFDGYLQTLVDAAGPISTMISDVAHQECSNAVPQTRNPSTPMVMLSEKCKGKGPQLLIKAPTEQVYDQDYQGGKGSFPLSVVAHVSKKRSSQDESNSSHGDHCWKKERPYSDKSGDTDLAVIKIHDSVDSPSRTFTSNGGRALSRERVRARLSSNLQKHPTASVSVFDRKKVVLSYSKMFISELWTVIRGKLFGSNVDCASSLKEEVQVILDEIDGKDVDVSPLMKLLKSFFKLAAIYDQARLTLHDKDMEAARKELSITTGERLSNAMLEEHEMIE